MSVRDFGAMGDGVHLDSDAFNAAIFAVATAGGGTVAVPPGRYLCFSIRLRSDITIAFEQGATIVAADPARHAGTYDLPEDRGEQLYQDFGHSHWHNSLIWGDGVTDVAIVGPGVIDGAGLTRDGPGARWSRQAGERPLSMAGMTAEEIDALELDGARMQGLGNKAIALREARRVRLAGFSILSGGHFAILATGGGEMEIADLLIDTGRDGIDLDCVSDVSVARCRVNTPNDDAIVVKSSLALGRAVASERIVIRDCHVSGFDLGSVAAGAPSAEQQIAPDRDRVTGRIKLGTESNGGFRDIMIERCRFERSRGLAIESVDGGPIENVVARDLMMDDVTTAPLFVRLGDRRRGPEGTGIATVRDVRIERVRATGIDPRFAAILAGLPDHCIANVTLSDIELHFTGGGVAVPDPPELADAYPEPSMFGPTPAWGLWARHVDGLTLEEVRLHSPGDGRPAIHLDDVLSYSRTGRHGSELLPDPA